MVSWLLSPQKNNGPFALRRWQHWPLWGWGCRSGITTNCKCNIISNLTSLPGMPHSLPLPCSVFHIDMHHRKWIHLMLSLSHLLSIASNSGPVLCYYEQHLLSFLAFPHFVPRYRSQERNTFSFLRITMDIWREDMTRSVQTDTVSSCMWVKGIDLIKKGLETSAD